MTAGLATNVHCTPAARAVVVEHLNSEIPAGANWVTSTQIEHQRVLPNDETPNVLAGTVDVDGVDFAPDGHHRRQRAAVSPNLGATAVKRAVFLSSHERPHSGWRCDGRSAAQPVLQQFQQNLRRPKAASNSLLNKGLRGLVELPAMAKTAISEVVSAGALRQFQVSFCPSHATSCHAIAAIPLLRCHSCRLPVGGLVKPVRSPGQPTRRTKQKSPDGKSSVRSGEHQGARSRP